MADGHAVRTAKQFPPKGQDPRPARRFELAAAPRGRARRWPAARRRRCGIGENPCPDKANRVPARRAQRAPRPDHGDHLHQQGRGRDEGTRHGAGRQARQRDVGVDVSLHVRASAPPRGENPRHVVEPVHLRHRRHAPADHPRRARPRPRPEALPGPHAVGAHLEPEERARRRGHRGRPRHQRHGAPGRRGLHRVPAAAERRQRARLRRPDHAHGRAVAGAPGRRRVLPQAVPPRARRRVPGHQPRAVHAGP